jgi:hypothetical protein
MEKKLLPNLIIFVVLIIIGLIGWLVITNLIAPPQVEKNLSVQNVLQPATINPELATESLDLMSNRRSLDEDFVRDFPVFIENENVDDRRPDVLQLAIANPKTPLDTQFGTLQQLLASRSGTLETVSEGGASTNYSAVAAGEAFTDTTTEGSYNEN